jgi:hypothetical protein
LIFFKVFNLFSPLKSYEKVELNCGNLQNDFFYQNLFLNYLWKCKAKMKVAKKKCFPEILFLSKVAFYMKCSTDNFTDLKQQRIPFFSFLLFIHFGSHSLFYSFAFSMFSISAFSPCPRILSHFLYSVHNRIQRHSCSLILTLTFLCTT